MPGSDRPAGRPAPYFVTGNRAHIKLEGTLLANNIQGQVDSLGCRPETE